MEGLALEKEIDALMSGILQLKTWSIRFCLDYPHTARQECQGVEKWIWEFWNLVKVFRMTVGMWILPFSVLSTVNFPQNDTTFMEAIDLGMRERLLVAARRLVSWLLSYALRYFRVRHQCILWCINALVVSISNAFLKDGSSACLIKYMDVRKKGVCWRIWKICESSTY